MFEEELTYHADIFLNPHSNPSASGWKAGSFGRRTDFPASSSRSFSPLERLVGTFVRSTFLDGRGADLEAVETFDGGIEEHGGAMGSGKTTKMEV